MGGSNHSRSEQEASGGADGLTSVDVACAYQSRLGRPSPRTAAVGTQFGIPLFAGPVTVLQPARISLGPARLVAFVGPSGSGKSSALAQIERQFAGACMVGRVSFPDDAAIVDRTAPWRSERGSAR